jgi:enterochelin esterase family protein
MPPLLLMANGRALGDREAQMKYTYTKDSERQSDVPRGSISSHQYRSETFAGTLRDYWVYVPAQYRPTAPAALMIFQDGHVYLSDDAFRTPIVFDNLIQQRAMPVTLGLFINPGHAGKSAPDKPWHNDNRSHEYDSLTEKYSRFLIEEMIPELEKSYTISADPKRRALAGISSGGICAFTAAWQRPDCFHKVLSHVGSFTDIRGGHVYPSYVRQWAKRDIKVFLQSGEQDLDTQFGNWWLANLQMKAALEFKKYDCQFVGGSGGHTPEHGAAILPDSLRWLWADQT